MEWNTSPLQKNCQHWANWSTSQHIAYSENNCYILATSVSSSATLLDAVLLRWEGGEGEGGAWAHGRGGGVDELRGSGHCYRWKPGRNSSSRDVWHNGYARAPAALRATSTESSWLGVSDAAFEGWVQQRLLEPRIPSKEVRPEGPQTRTNWTVKERSVISFSFCMVNNWFKTLMFVEISAVSKTTFTDQRTNFALAFLTSVYLTQTISIY